MHGHRSPSLRGSMSSAGEAARPHETPTAAPPQALAVFRLPCDSGSSVRHRPISALPAARRASSRPGLPGDRTSYISCGPQLVRPSRQQGKCVEMSLLQARGMPSLDLSSPGRLSSMRASLGKWLWQPRKLRRTCVPGRSSHSRSPSPALSSETRQRSCLRNLCWTQPKSWLPPAVPTNPLLRRPASGGEPRTARNKGSGKVRRPQSTT
jgi:hypothetical protein